MFGIRSIGKGGHRVAVVDVSSGSAAVALVEIRRGESALVSAARRIALPLESRSREATITGIGTALQQAASEVATAGAAGVRNVYCIVRAPWVRSRTARVERALGQEQKITERHISELAKDSLATVQLDRKGLIEATVIRVELNGYPTDAPVGKRARTISATSLVSECEPDLTSAVRSQLERTFPQAKIIYRSSARALLSALASKADAEPDFFIVDMAGEGTTMIAVRDGVAEDQHVIAEGSRTIIRRVAGARMPEETLTLVRLLGNDECSTAACEEIAHSLASAEPELVRIFGEGMSVCAEKRRLPNTMVLLSHPDLGAWLKHFFSRIDFAQFTSTTQAFTVRALTNADFASDIELSRPATLDTGLAVCIALVNREESQR